MREFFRRLWWFLSFGPTYTVKKGDTLSQIAKDHLGDGNAYPRIFDMNKDRVGDPDKIYPGQKIRLPRR